MDLPGSALQDLPTSQQLLGAIQSRQTINLGQFELTLREHTYHWGLERSWHFDTTWSSPFQQNYEDISHTFWCTFGKYFWMVGWQKRNQKPVLPLYLRLDISSNLSRALSCLCHSGHNFLVQRMRHDRNRRPYELRICDRCDWHTIQDEEHMHFVGLSTWTSGQTSHPTTAYLPTSVWGWPSSFEDLSEPTWYFWCCLFCS